MGEEGSNSPPSSGPLFDQFLLTSVHDGKPVVLFRLTEDPFPPTVASFCFPDFKTVRPIEPSAELEFFAFVLTDEDGSKQYGFCARSPRPWVKGAHPSLCYCFLTQWPWFGYFRSLLTLVVEFCVENGPSQNLDAPIPELVDALRALHSTPIPAAGGHFSASPLGLETLPAVPVQEELMPLVSDVQHKALLESLTVTKIVILVASVLMERRIILYSSNLSRISDCVHSLISLTYPFTWQHVFVATLPTDLLLYCEAPMPFILGVLKQDIEEVQRMALSQVVMVDLDTGHIYSAVNDSSFLPTDLSYKLRDDLTAELALMGASGTFDYSVLPNTFLDFFVTIFWKYRKYLLHSNVPFNFAAFVKSQPRSRKKFLHSFARSQMWEQWLSVREAWALKRGPAPRGPFERTVDVMASRESDGNCSLHYAAAGGDVRKLNEALLSEQDDVNLQNAAGETPLFWASRKGHVGIIRCLLEHGANPYIADKDERTAFQVAATKEAWAAFNCYLLSTAGDMRYASQSGGDAGEPVSDDVVRALSNLSIVENSMKDVPTSLCSLTNLSTLRLVSNRLRSLPPDVKSLAGSLKTIDLSNNLFRELPPALLGLTSLTELDFKGNSLRELPSSIKKLDQLRKLDLSTNDLRVIPADIAALTKLRSLTLRKNRNLTSLPTELGLLKSVLVHLDLKKTDLGRSIPSSVLKSDTAQILLWLFQAHSGETSSGRIKVLVLGPSGAGKSAMLAAIKGEKRKYVPPTVGLDAGDAQTLASKGKEHQVVVTTFDFAGKSEYLATHTYFVSSGLSVYIIVINVTLPWPDQQEELKQWLGFLLENMDTNAVDHSVVLVGTHIDLIGVSKKELRRDLDTFLTPVLLTHSRGLNVERQWWLVSGVSGDGIGALRKHLKSTVSQLCERKRTMVPRHYVAAERVAERIVARNKMLLVHLYEWNELFYADCHDLGEARLFSQFSNADGGAQDRALIGAYLVVGVHPVFTPNAEHLHNIGLIVFLKERDVVCLRPAELSKVMALFVAPGEGLARIFGMKTSELPRGRVRVPLVPYDDAVSRLVALRGYLARGNSAVLREKKPGPCDPAAHGDDVVPEHRPLCPEGADCQSTNPDHWIVMRHTAVDSEADRNSLVSADSESLFSSPVLTVDAESATDERNSTPGSDLHASWLKPSAPDRRQRRSRTIVGGVRPSSGDSEGALPRCSAAPTDSRPPKKPTKAHGREHRKDRTRLTLKKTSVGKSKHRKKGHKHRPREETADGGNSAEHRLLDKTSNSSAGKQRVVDRRTAEEPGESADETAVSPPASKEVTEVSDITATAEESLPTLPAPIPSDKLEAVRERMKQRHQAAEGSDAVDIALLRPTSEASPRSVSDFPLPDEDVYKECLEYLRRLELVDFCFELSSLEAAAYGHPGFYFPCLAPHAERFYLPDPNLQREASATDSSAEVDVDVDESHVKSDHRKKRRWKERSGVILRKGASVPLFAAGRTVWKQRSPRPTGIRIEPRSHIAGSWVPSQVDTFVASAVQGTMRPLGEYVFFRFQVATRHYHYPGFKLFSNGVVLREDTSAATVGLLRFDGGRIFILTRGAHAVRLQGALHRTLRETTISELAVLPLCPHHGQIIGRLPILSKQKTVPSALGDGIGTPESDNGEEDSLPVDVPGEEWVCDCEERHVVSTNEALEGAPADDETFNHAENDLWAPVNGQLFFEEKPEAWTPDLVNPSLSYTTLTDEETTAARANEFKRARAAFSQFVGTDKQNDYSVKKVIFFYNHEQESDFRELFKLRMNDSLAKSWADRDSSSELLSSVTPRSGEHRGSPSLERRSVDVGMPETLPPLSARGPLETGADEMRRATTHALTANLAMVSGSERVNLLTAWSAPRNDQAFGFARTGMPVTGESVGSTLYGCSYGTGAYLTQYPRSGTRFIAQKGLSSGAPLLLSWVLMGRTYPVTQSDVGSLKDRGGAPMEGVDSHYVLLRNGTPCTTGQSPSEDRIVVFQTEQVLPRYLVFFHKRAMLPLDDVGLALIWLDPDPFSTSSSNFIKELATHTPPITVFQLAMDELRSWLDKNEARASAMAKQGKLRLLASRPDESAAEAIEQLVKWVHNHRLWKKIPVMIYTGPKPSTSALALHNPKHKVFVSYTGLHSADTKKFAAFEMKMRATSIPKKIPLRKLKGERKDR